MGSHPKTISGNQSQSFIYVWLLASPYVKPTLLYLTKLYEPIVVAIRLKAISHQENRCPPKKKSFVVFCRRPNQVPTAKMAMK